MISSCSRSLWSASIYQISCGGAYALPRSCVLVSERSSSVPLVLCRRCGELQGFLSLNARRHGTVLGVQTLLLLQIKFQSSPAAWPPVAPLVVLLLTKPPGQFAALGKCVPNHRRLPHSLVPIPWWLVKNGTITSSRVSWNVPMDTVRMAALCLLHVQQAPQQQH